MSALILQTALMLLGAYFVGAWLACVVRRSTMSYHADDGISARQTARAVPGLAPAGIADEAARAPVRRAEVVAVAPKIQTISRPTANPVPAPAALAPAAPAALAPAAPAAAVHSSPVRSAPVAPAPAAVPPAAANLDNAARFQAALTGAPRQPVPVAPSPVTPVVTAPVPTAPVPMPPVPAGPVISAPAAVASAAVTTATAAAAKALAPSTAAVAPAPSAAVPVPATPKPVVAAPVVSAAPFTIPTPAASRPHMTLPVAAGSSGQTSAAAPIAAVAPLTATPVAAGVPVASPAPTATVTAPSASVPSVSAANAPVPGAPAPTALVGNVSAPGMGADDLTRIRAIDSGLHAKLHQLGVRRYADIAAWAPADVTRISSALGFHGRIEQENWIEQAQILSRGGETAFARRKDRGEALVAAPTVHAGTAKPMVVAPAATVGTAAASVAAAVAAPVVIATAAVAKTVVAAPPAVHPAAPVVAPAVSVIAARVEPAIAVAPVAQTAASVQAPVAAAITPETATSRGPQVAERAAFGSTLTTAAGTTPVAPVAVTPAAATAVPTTAAGTVIAANPVSALGRDNLQRIGGINAEVERVLNVQGVGKYNQIANWGEKDTTRFDRLLGYEGRIARENWIEQAQILNRNGETAYSRQFDQQHGGKTTVPPVPAALQTSSLTPTLTPAVPQASQAAAASAALAAASTAAVAKAATAVASATGTAVPDAPRPLRLPDPVADPVKVAPVPTAIIFPSAATLAGAAAPVTAAVTNLPTSVSAMPTPAMRTGELAGLRSVRSEAYSAAPSKSGPDDLKRIRGVGVLIERKLNTMGINSYAQIANWTSSEIDRVSQVLDFKGKVERENWVEQARILSAGGQTEFSRRVDRGDDVNKPK